MLLAFDLEPGFPGKPGGDSLGAFCGPASVDALPAHPNACSAPVGAFPDSNEAQGNVGPGLDASASPGTRLNPDRFGPWAADLSPIERAARLRCLRTLARLLAPHETELLTALQKAETEPAAYRASTYKCHCGSGTDARAQGADTANS
jgi:hypothetical protein